MPETEVLKIQIGPNTDWIGGHWIIPERVGGYHGLLKQWFDHFGLEGKGLVIGEPGSGGEAVKQGFKDEYGVEAYSVDMAEDPFVDIVWDITKPLETEEKYGWIVCQAVLEHVTDPVASVKNMSALLQPGGRLYIHVPGPDFPYHAYPVDCYRFFRDALVAWAEIADLEIDDLLCTPEFRHYFVVYRRR